MIRTTLPAACLLVLALITAPSAGAAWNLERSTPVTGIEAMDVNRDGQQVVIYDEGFGTEGIRRYGRGGELLNGWPATAQPYGIAFDGENVLALESQTLGPSALVRYGPGGNAFEALILTDPTPPAPDAEVFAMTLDVDPKGEIYVGYSDTADDDLTGIQRLSPTGQRIAFWEGPQDAVAGHFQSIPQIASDGAGNVFTAEFAGNRIQRFTDTGSPVSRWGQFGIEPGQLVDPTAIAIGPGGDVWVGDSPGGLRLQRFRADGAFVEQIRLPSDLGTSVTGIGFDSAGRLYAATGPGQRSGGIYVYSQTSPAPPPDSAGISLRSKSLRLRGGKVAVKLACGGDSACRGRIVLRKGKLKLGGRAYRIAAGRTGTVKVKLSGKGRRALSRARKHRVRVVLQPKGGTKLTRAVTLRR